VKRLNRVLFSNSKNRDASSYWLQTGTGLLTASGAPSIARLSQGSQKGATDVVTLLRKDEMKPFLPTKCEELGLDWHHFPLSGRKMEASADRISLSSIPSIVEFLKNGKHVVVHCAAGMHRTGVCLYLILRWMGNSQNESLEKIQHIRPVIRAELEKSTRKQGLLKEKAEFCFQKILAPLSLKK